MYRLAHAHTALCTFLVALAASLIVSALAPASAEASPWTVQEDQFVLTLASNYQSADEEFLPDGELQSFPLSGRFSAYTLGLGGRYGFTDRFEGAFKVNFKQVNYEANPVLLAPPEDGGDTAALNNAILDFSRSSAGAGDVFFHGRYNFMRGSVMMTTDTSLKFPTGYDQPSGTFADPTAPTPTTVEDDVTLGDGQTDLTQSVLVGTYLPSLRTFMRLDAGYRHRFGSPGDQAVGSFSVGKYLGDKVVAFVGANGVYTVFEGEPVGQSFITRTPEKSASELSMEDIETIEIRLDKDYLNVEAGVILQLPEVEMRASYGQLVWGNNVSRVQSLSLAIVYALDDLTQ